MNNSTNPKAPLADPDSEHFQLPEHEGAGDGDAYEAGPVEAWQEVEPGRFMPKRVRGSCVGRALG